MPDGLNISHCLSLYHKAKMVALVLGEDGHYKNDFISIFFREDESLSVYEFKNTRESFMDVSIMRTYIKFAYDWHETAWQVELDRLYAEAKKGISPCVTVE